MDSEADVRSALAGLVGIIVSGDAYRLAAAEHFGLGVADTHAISYLDTYGPMPQSTLARHMGVTSGGATGIVDRLERAGIVRRATDPTDRRKYQVELTDRARGIVDESLARLTRVFDDVDPEVLATLGRALPQVVSGLDRQTQVLRAPKPQANGAET